MRKTFKYISHTLLLAMAVTPLLTGCEDRFEKYANEPEWLGDNIYDYLSQKGNFTYFLRLIDDCGYRETMQRTGSVTLFAADDAAFERYFSKEGITYSQMSQSLKYTVMRMGLLEDSYLIDRMADTETGSVGQIIRRHTALEITDTIPLVDVSAVMPATSYWEKYSGRKMRLLDDGTAFTLTHFIESALAAKNITDRDMTMLLGREREYNDVYIYGIKVKERDITCKNGYINIVEDLLLPPDNMAGYIRRSNGDGSPQSVSLFNDMMGRFCAPYYSQAHSTENDSVFRLRYFNSGNNRLTTDPDNKTVTPLLFDPAWNSSSPTASGYSTDMPVMFVPSNKAMQEYLSATGEGADLYQSFGSWENLPTIIAADFVSNHMKNSFLTALPTQFGTMKDEAGYVTDIKWDNVDSVFIARNGVVYRINKVLPPLDYRTVMGPVKVSLDAIIFQKAQSTSYVSFIYYLRSLLNKYHYFATTDEGFTDYRNPVSQGYTIKENLDFRIVNEAINAKVNRADTGDSLRLINSSALIKNLLTDILDQQTIVGEINRGQTYYITKGYAPLKVTDPNGNAPAIDYLDGQAMFAPGTLLYGGGNIERGDVSHIPSVVSNYSKENGAAYFIDGVVQPASVSVYETLRSRPEFSKFLDLLASDYSEMFQVNPTNSTYAIGSKVRFFDYYHYTLYIPTNEAVQQALDNGWIPSDEMIGKAETLAERNALIEKRERILRYHFQDNSTFIGGVKADNTEYLSATLNSSTKKFYPLFITQDYNSLSVNDYYNHSKGSHTPASVIKTEGLYNLMTRDLVVNNRSAASATQIETSSFAVIHQVDRMLWFEEPSDKVEFEPED